MHKKQRIKQIVTVLLPVIFLLGVVLTIPRGNVLKADDSEQPFAHVKINGKTVSLTDTVVNEDTAQVELTGKENRWVRLSASKHYAVYPEGTVEETQTKVITYQELLELMQPSTKESVPVSSESQQVEINSLTTLSESQQSQGTSSTESSSTESTEAVLDTSVSSSEIESNTNKKQSIYRVEEGTHAGIYFLLVKDETLLFQVNLNNS